MSRIKSESGASPRRVTRRRFLRDSSGWAAGLAGAAGLVGSAAGQASQPGPGDTVVLGVIGCGRRGRQLIEAASRVPGITVSAVCDVHAERTTAAAERVAALFGQRASTTGDHRQLLEGKDLHGVIIATPDHWHATQFLDACAAGKDVYVETPVSHYQTEANAMLYATKKYKRVAQAGLQLRSSPRFAEAVGIVQSGTLGRVAQTRTWTFARRSPIPAQPDSVPPSGLDYDRWLGPAAERPYNPVRYEYPEHFWDYGAGEAGCWNIHLQDLVHAAMSCTVPVSVGVGGGQFGLEDSRETPDVLDAVFEYAPRRGRFIQTYSLRLSNAYAGWGPAGLPPAANGLGSLPARSGVQFFGSEKTLFVGPNRLLLLPAGEESALEDLGFLGIGGSEPASRAVEEAEPLTVAHLKDFVEGIRARKQPCATIEAAQWAMVPCMAANTAYRVGRKLFIKGGTLDFYTDPEFKNADAEAKSLQFKPYREKYRPPRV